MGNTITLKKSVVSGKIPTTNDLKLGEVSINHADRVFHARHPGTGEVQQIGAKAVHTHVLTDITDLGDLQLVADWNDMINKPDASSPSPFSSVAFTGSYADLINKPTSSASVTLSDTAQIGRAHV